MCRKQADYSEHIMGLEIIRGIHGSMKYGLIRVLLFNRELQIADHYEDPYPMNNLTGVAV